MLRYNKATASGGIMSFLNEIITFLFGAALFINAALFLPQIYALWKSRDAKGISLLTFFGFCLIQLVTVCYGLSKHDYLLAGGNALSLLLCSSICFMILFYRYSSLKK
jgi:MtN3 and saliva related transmembrane protein